jgi:hypothetical protein
MHLTHQLLKGLVGGSSTEPLTTNKIYGSCYKSMSLGFTFMEKENEKKKKIEAIECKVTWRM